MSDASKRALLAVGGTMLAASAVAVALRFFVRKRQKMAVLVDDVFALMAWIVNLGSIICVFLLIHWKALGYAVTQVSPEQAAATAVMAGKVELAYSILRPITLALIKLSALYFYRRIFCVGSKSQLLPRLITATVIIVVLWLVAFEFLAGFECGTHVDALWIKTEYEKYCTIVFPELYGFAISDLILDVWVLAIPLPLIMRLNANLKQRLSIVAVFLLSFIGLAASIGRVVVYAAIENGGPTYFVTHDEELALSRTFFFDLLEAGVTLVAINLPSLWSLVSHFKPGEFWRSIYSVFTNTVSTRRSGSEAQDGLNDAERGRANHLIVPKSWDDSADQPKGDNYRLSYMYAAHAARGLDSFATEDEKEDGSDEAGIRMERTFDISRK